GQKVVETEIGFLLMSMNLTKLAKKIVQDNRDKKKNTDSSAEFYQNQLESICVFYLLASFCPASSRYN
ncbi:MAG: IS5/IS1182 family transposase, partial [Streptococcus suis]